MFNFIIDYFTTLELMRTPLQQTQMELFILSVIVIFAFLFWIYISLKRR